jgi:hypothetical protein
VRTKNLASAYEAFRSAGQGVKVLYDFELNHVAKAINPAASDYGRLQVMDDYSFADGYGACDCLASHAMSFLLRMRETLLFLRLQTAAHTSEIVSHRLSLVAEYDAGQGRRFWLNCETGMPWRPEASARVRASMSAERQAQSEERWQKANAAATAALKELRQRALSYVAPERKAA